MTSQRFINMQQTDLTVDTFLTLRDAFFGDDMIPRRFYHRDKRNTQDDPLDEYIASLLSSSLSDAICQKAPGPLVSPDLTIYRPELCNDVSRELLGDDTSRIVALEVKKLERSKAGQIARPTGMDYNTTPPCGTVRVYDRDGNPLDIRGFYLFVSEEKVSNQEYIVSALALCDGNILNQDFDYYLSIVSQREKKIGLGTYRNGADRNRPMLIFPNPLSGKELDHEATLVNKDEPTHSDTRLALTYRINRTIPDTGEVIKFFAYRKPTDLPSTWEVETLVDPFLQPATRVAKTQSRGKFRVQIKPR